VPRGHDVRERVLGRLTRHHGAVAALADRHDLRRGGAEDGPRVEGVDLAHPVEAGSLEQSQRGQRFLVHLPQFRGHARVEQRRVEWRGRKQVEDERLVDRAAPVGLGVRHAGEAAPERLPEGVAALGVERGAHLREQGPLEAGRVPRDEREASPRQQLAGAPGLTAGVGVQDQRADLARTVLGRFELQRAVPDLHVDAFGVALLLAYPQEQVRHAAAAVLGQDDAGADHPLVVADQRELVLPLRMGRGQLRERALAANQALAQEAAIGREVRAVEEPRQPQQLAQVVHARRSQEVHAASSMQSCSITDR